MKSWRTFLLTALIVTAAVSCRSLRPPVTGGTAVKRSETVFGQKAVDAAFADIRTYRFGDSAKSSRYLADLVRRTSNDSARRRELATRLRSLLTDAETTADAKRFACRGLAVIGGPSDVPSLAPLLLDEDLSQMARYALERVPGDDAEKALLAALSENSGAIRIGLINSLGERRDPAALPRLKPLIAAKTADVAAAAAMALAKIGTPEALHVLEAAAKSAPAAGGPNNTTEALLVCAENVAAANPAAAATAAEAVFRSATAPHVKAAALNALVHARKTDSVPLIVELLADGDAGNQGVAIRFVREMPGRDATHAFAAQLPKVAGLGKVRLINALADRGDAAAANAVQRQLTDADPGVRQAAISALGVLGGGESVADLLAIAAKPGTEQREAREALIRLKGRSVDTALIHGLRDASAVAVCESIRALGKRQTVRAVSALLKVAATHPDSTVRTDADKALAELAGVDRVRRLVALVLNARDDTERAAAARALSTAARRSGSVSASTQTRIRAALEHATVPAQCALLGVLGRVGGQASFTAVQESLAAGAPAVREAAIRALADWPDPTPIPTLEHLASAAEDDLTHVLCLRGLVRLLGLPADRPATETADLFRSALGAARRTDEKKLVIGGLGKLDSAAALGVAMPYVSDTDLASEAVAAVAAIADKLAEADRAAAENALKKALATVTDPDLDNQLRTALERIQRFDDFVSQWEIAGPYSHGKMKNKELFDFAFSPEPGMPDTKTVKWSIHTPPEDPRKAWIVELDKIANLKGDNRVAYLRTWIRASAPTLVRFEIGSDDGVRAWLNNAVVLERNANRALSRGEDKAEVQLRAGWNCLLLKITQGSGFWSACARVRDLQGEHIDGLIYYGTPGGLEACRTDLTATWPERTAALDVLAEWPDPEGALGVLLDHLDVPNALDAATRLVKRIARTSPAAAESALEKVAARVSDASARAEVQAVRTELNQYRGYIKRWMITGPYTPVPGKTPFEDICPDEPDGKGRSTSPRLVKLPAATTRRAIEIDLNKLYGHHENCSVCLRTVLHSSEAFKARLELGSDDGVKVWLNGTLVYTMDAHRPVKPAEDSVPIQLKQGWNSLLFKVAQGSGGWGLCARIVSPDGQPLPGVDVVLAGERQALWPNPEPNKEDTPE